MREVLRMGIRAQVTLYFVFIFTPVGLLSGGLSCAMAQTEALLEDDDAGTLQIMQIIQNRMEHFQTQGELNVAGVGVVAKVVLPVYYEGRAYRPVWTMPGAVTELLQTIAVSAQDGLVPDDYHLAAIQSLVDVADSSSEAAVESGGIASADSSGEADADPAVEAARLADLDILCTDAFLCLAYHLTYGKVDPEGLDPNWNIYGQTIELSEVIRWMYEVLDTDEAGNIGRAIDEVRPQQPIYRRLMTSLVEYEDLADKGGWPVVPEGQVLKEGMRDPSVVQLRQRLAVTGDLAADAASSGDQDKFDGDVKAAVTHFQTRHGLDADGVVGRQTLEALNVPVTQRVDQIRVNLERLRWVLNQVVQEFVVVNIADFRVFYMKGEELLFDARAQVGKPYRETPVFWAPMKYLVFNPTWTVPPTIKREDTFPRAQKDQSYLQKKNMVVIDSQGRTIPPDQIDWQSYTGKNFPYTFRQEPGPNNALGRVKFIFPNEHFVFLHDTASQTLFSRSERAFSSGCIRVEHPLVLAEKLLDDPDKWSLEDIEQLVDSAQTKTVHLKEPVPVLLLYWTAFDYPEQQAVHLRKDIYGRDQAVLVQLDSKFTGGRERHTEDVRQQ